MDFLNPLLLAGVGAAAVPIILHLIMRQNPRRLEFPALRFVRQRREANRRRMRLRHLLLLLLRVAVICLLAAALARPSLKASGLVGNQEVPVAAALVFDTSPRMQYRHQNQTRLEMAQEIGDWLVSQLPPESQVAVLESRLNSAVFQVDASSARQRIKRLETTTSAQSLSLAFEEALRLLGTSDRQRKELYVFTDLAARAWAIDSPQRLQDRIKKLADVGIYIVDVGVEEPQNFALGEVRLSAQVLSKNSSLRISTELTGIGPGGERSVELLLLDETGQPQRRARESGRITGGSSQALEFTLGGMNEGTLQGFLRIEGSDGLPTDDKRFFTVEVRPPWKVLVAAQEPIEVQANFLTQALAPDEFRKTGRSRFNCEVVTWTQLAKTPLPTFAAVCLLDPPPLPLATWQQLATYANEGGGVAVFLGRHAEPAQRFNQSGATELLPAELELQARGVEHLAPDNYQSPALGIFRSLEGTVPWDAFPVYRYWQLGALAEGSNVLVPYSNGRPALVERPLGQGTVLLMTTPVSDLASQNPWNLLPIGTDAWPFMLLVNGIASYLVGSTEGQLNCLVGAPAVLPLDGDARVSSYLLTTPGGEEIRRPADSTRGEIVVTSTDQEGNYRVRTGGEHAGLRRGFSVNLPASATDLTRTDPDHLKKVFGEADFHLARNREQIEREVVTGRVGRELYPFLIVLVVLALGSEQVLANRFYRDTGAEVAKKDL